MIVDRDVMIPMRDGIQLAADIYRQPSDQKMPALLALSPYGKNLQALSLTLPPQARPNPLWDGGIEAGDIRRIVDRGYAHVIADVRGTGGSEGELCGNYDSGGHGEGKDIYDLVEWLAVQPWCDGNIGMVGISYFATVQVLGAAEAPPHLKAIFCNGGHFDLYELAYHGGVLWLMPRASREGRGGDSGVAVGRVKSKLREELSEADYSARVAERLSDPDIQNWPNLTHVISYPETHELWLDFVLNPLDGPFYREGSPVTHAHKVEIPAYFQSKWGRGWTIDGTIDTYARVKGPRKLDLLASPPMQERPFHESHEEMLRWYDYWLKGIDNGIMDEPEVNYFLEGAREWRGAQSWPPQVDWVPFFLRPRHRLAYDPEPLSAEHSPPDGFYQAPLTVTSENGKVVWMTDALLEDIEMAGSGAMHLFAAIDTDDTNFIVKLYDVDPHGKKRQVTTGFLKASHRELDETLSTPGRPHHPHTSATPVTPHEIVEYAIRLYTFANVFKKGHRIRCELSCNESFTDEHAQLLPPDSFHLPSGRATAHKIFRDRDHQSHLLLPIVAKQTEK
ncbi:CocE/NonD family hydrolase [Pelagibacterium lacus]|uniref:CocE/NonD family hydrolase n=2 Tax=Pelagibacterium lacus TaxID=2282655 RepID=A0A369W731_9HYPH|nr:CocE/NonD family hydrolase [Pelagibacterium lacus]